MIRLRRPQRNSCCGVGRGCECSSSSIPVSCRSARDRGCCRAVTGPVELIPLVSAGGRALSTPVCLRIATAPPCKATEPGPMRSRMASILFIILSSFLSAALASANERAVRAKNGRVRAFYEYSHVDSEEAFRFPTNGAPVLENIPEIDVDEGGVRGTYTMPRGSGLPGGSGGTSVRRSLVEDQLRWRWERVDLSGERRSGHLAAVQAQCDARR